MCVALLQAGAGGCATRSDVVGATAPERALPSYDAQSAELFDDAIEPAAVGYALESTPTFKAPALRDRTLTADAVVRARAVTLTSSHEDASGSWQLGLRTLETLAGTAAPGSFTLEIKATDPSAGVIRASEGRIAGMTFVAFLRAFAEPAKQREERSAQLHFHVAPDSKDEVDAVRKAALLGEVR
ncbi:MAG: hypothetical protein FWD17_14610 [Polyangiaceae bacterium]|nr:hypothetical protein [Polyangiaceae bacterium]